MTVRGVSVGGARNPKGQKLTERHALRGWWWDGKRMHPKDLDGIAWQGGTRVNGVDVLRIDVDGRRKLSVQALADRLKKNNRQLGWVVERRSPSGRGWHRWIGVWPRPATAVETVALQLLCGSDPHREAYNLNRAVQVDAGQVSAYWRTRWNVFYKREPERKGKGKP
jgi:hypothetical protein